MYFPDVNNEINDVPFLVATDVTVILVVARTQRKAKGIMISTDGSYGLDEFQRPRRSLELYCGIEFEKMPWLYRTQNHAKHSEARGMSIHSFTDYRLVGGAYYGRLAPTCTHASCMLMLHVLCITASDCMRNARSASLNPVKSTCRTLKFGDCL